jgi:hypothetical protein
MLSTIAGKTCDPCPQVRTFMVHLHNITDIRENCVVRHNLHR